MNLNFELILCAAVVVTGAMWAADKLFFARQRKKAADAAVAEFDRQQARIDQRMDGGQIDETQQKLRDDKLRQPWWLEYSAGLFMVILAVFIVRSFVVEPYRIPSGSMMPTLLDGDFILVNKFGYGLRMPLTNQRLTQGAPLKRGDVVVFRYPFDESTDFIKRVIGLPGDTVMYIDKMLTINGQPVPETPLPDYYMMKQYRETIDGTRRHAILINQFAPNYMRDGVRAYKDRDACQYNDRGFVCKVPPGDYFMMGDNRDDSDDSRYWGFVPDKDIIGKAFFIWMNFGNFKRIGSFQ